MCERCNIIQCIVLTMLPSSELTVDFVVVGATPVVSEVADPNDRKLKIY